MILFFQPLMIGTVELALLAAAGLLLFGGKKLPDIMRKMGRGVKEFKEGVQGAPDHFQEGLNDNDEGHNITQEIKDNKDPKTSNTLDEH